jgi:hypothetical protein
MPGKDDPSSSRSMLYSSISAGSISAAPNLDLYSNVSPVIGPTARDHSKIDQTTEEEAPKKKTKTYPTEAWPGRKPVHSAI